MRLANLAILVLLGLPSVVLADGKADKIAAQKHVDLAKRHYNVAKYDEAIAEFKEAYTLDPDPADLFNIAQAYRLKKDCENAALFYANYQREETNKKLRDSVTKVRADMEACAKQAENEAKPEPKPAPPPPPTGVAEPGPVPGPAPVTAPAAPLPPPTDAPATDPDPNRIRRITGKVLMVGGAGLLVLALLELNDVSSFDHKLTDAGCDLEQPDDPARCDELASDRQSASNAAAGSLLVGGASAIVGFVLWRVSRKPDRPNVTVIPRRNGAVLSWSF